MACGVKNMTSQSAQVPAATGDTVDITYPTKLTSNILDALKIRKQKTGVPVATQIRRAVERELSEVPVGQPLPENDLRLVLRETLSEVLVNSVPVSVDRVRRARLEELARELGFAETGHFLQDLAFRALENPKAAEQFLFAQLERTALDEAKIDEATAKAAAKKPRRKINTEAA